MKDLRESEERIAVKVVGLNDLARVLEDDFDEVTEGGVDDVGSDGEVREGGVGGVGDEIVLEDLIGDAIVLGKLERCLGVDVGDAIESITELAVGPANGVDQLDGAGDVNLTVVV